MPLGAFKTALFGAAGGVADYVCDPLGYAETSGSTGDGTPRKLIFSSIPQDYQYLILQTSLKRGSTAAAGAELTFNGGGGTNYYGRVEYMDSYSEFTTTNHPRSFFDGGFGLGFPSTSASYNGNPVLKSQWMIFGYSDAARYTDVKVTGAGYSLPVSGSNYRRLWHFAGEKKVSEAVTSIETMNGASHWDSTTIVALFGVRSE